MSVRTNFRTSLQTSLAAALSIPFVGGVLDGKERQRDLGCVWWEGKRPMARDGNEEENYYRVRVLKLFKQNQGETTARNITGLEDAAEELEAALKAVLITAGHQFFTVTELTVNYDDQWVEAQLLAYDRNRSAAGG